MAEGILAKLEENESLVPLAKVFKKLVEPKSITPVREGPSGSVRDVVGTVADPEVDLVLRLGEWSNGARLGIYFASPRLLREKPKTILSQMPNFSVFIDAPPPRPFGGTFDEVSAKVNILNLNLSSVSVYASLRILEDISSRYIALNEARRGEWLRQDH
ncbi:MAG: hypothetical protein UX88_C0020G0006 [Candidatus Woesebacteria bacterium GW2011_GWC2_47_16]|nr:MAG: hypothetical protein UX03_C0031G0002 [Candidatus Woesebacteria bacterium GW2011_GWE1_45_18]KKU46893.1 MAG: hypothetical protein UX67_C0055G0007 [Candidatus Woesebacteria bacterium GW2011_GWF2_46_8]KKU63892.1 MAG: hypothetical protein UX88_C0020G0006 [Candidatus Woesebacteria bacterium GW2011_GWC2_47_16]